MQKDKRRYTRTRLEAQKLNPLCNHSVRKLPSRDRRGLVSQPLEANQQQTATIIIEHCTVYKYPQQKY